MARVDISLGGRVYTLSCEEGQEQRLQAVASVLDEKLRGLTTTMANASEARLFMLAGLMLADEVVDLKSSGAVSSSGEEEELVEAVEHLTQRVAELASRFDSV